MNALDALETTFNCAGICQSSIYYTYSDIPKGIPSLTCTQSIVDYINAEFILFSIIAFSLAGGAFMGMLASCVTCCCYRKDHRP